MGEENTNIIDHQETAIQPEEGPDDKISRTLLKSFESLLKKKGNINTLFFSLVNKLNKFYSISRAILVIWSQQDRKLKAIAMKGNKSSRHGLALTLPENDSLLYTVFRNGALFTEDYPGQFSGNFIEEKMLVDETTKSLTIIPLKCDGTCPGLVVFASPIPYAFTMFEDGMLDAILERFGCTLTEKLHPINV